MRILIADDELHNRILMQTYLDSWGQCDLVHDGTEAVEAFEMASADDQPYDLICLDLFMPIMNGDEALRAIRTLESQQGIPPQYRTFIIFVTGQELQDNTTPMDECTGLLVKPITREQLYETLRANGFCLPDEMESEACTTKINPLSPIASTALQLELQAIPGLELVSGLERVMGNATLYRELLQHFVESHASDLENFQAALDANTQDLAMRILHGLKGSAGNISAQRVHLAAKALEATFRRNAPLEERIAPMTELTAAMDEILPALRALGRRS